ncbi:MAG TPA: prepilin-type N-terminal cleavage/methylation domain-containing protein [Burkholderiaceae bacterium]|nr:prepilin-type N-terminal cleavage/methylation domain-containing protein [Burkholderiaceae bacterium]
MRTSLLHAPRHQRGTTLIEALIAFLVLSLGLLAVARVQTQLRQNADVARQRSEAVRLAQEDLESLRAFAVLAAAPGARSFEAIADDAHTVESAGGSYLVTRRVDAAATPHAKNVSVGVAWTDRSGGAQQFGLASVIAGTAPAFSGALGLARTAAAKGALARSARIPLGAKDLGDGRSAFKPVGNGTLAFVFDNRSGALTGRCAGVDPAIATRDLTSASLGACDANVGQLLSGVVRFSMTSPPDAAQGNELPAAFTVALALIGGPYPIAPSCGVEAMKTVSYTADGSLHVEAVPVGALAASLGLPGWTETGERFAAYHCAVYPSANGRWSGQTTLVPSGWTIGTGASDRRVCRYSSDLDASGAIDTNLEHPASYTNVGASLANQNFLVIKGSEACPVGAPTQVAGNNADVYVDLSTVAHQP